MPTTYERNPQGELVRTTIGMPQLGPHARHRVRPVDYMAPWKTGGVKWGMYSTVNDSHKTHHEIIVSEDIPQAHVPMVRKVRGGRLFNTVTQ